MSEAIRYVSQVCCVAVQSASGLGGRALTFRKKSLQRGMTSDLVCRTFLFFHKAWIYTRDVLCCI